MVSVNAQFGADQPDFRGANKLGVCDGHLEKFTIECRGPEIEKRFELREARGKIVFLPDIAL